MKNILEMFETSVQRDPNRTAVTDGKMTFSYQALQKVSQRCGSQLAQQHIRNQPIGVYMEKGTLTLTAFMGIVYSGNFYVLLNPELPDQRLSQMAHVLQTTCLITDQAHLEKAREIFDLPHILTIETLMEAAIRPEILTNIRQRCIDTDPLYANFTSGSTGIPKGVVVSHRSVIDFIQVFTRTFHFQKEDVFGNQAPFDFDVSVKDIYSAWACGGQLVIIPKALFSQPTALLDYICEHHITIMIWAVSALCLISTFHGLDYRTPETVRQVLFSGETMPLKHLKNWLTHLPETTFVNLYGPTEITCNCTYHQIERQRDYTQGLPIGQPFDNEDVFLLDQNDQGIGEICVRGSALALGYFNAWEQTTAHFVQNPLNSAYPERIYRTGDLGYWDHQELYFVGRKDDQIKYQGHRIELGEIEKAMDAIEGVERCCCIYDHNRQKLYGFYIGNLSRKALHSELKKRLPPFMIPNALRQKAQFPLTKNGKIDRRALLKGEEHVS